MPDNLNLKQPHDAGRINLGQKHEIDYWTRTLNVSEAMLRLAVERVGDSVSKVKAFLGIK